MARSTIHDRLERQIDREADELAGLDPAANLTAVHVATIDTLTAFLELGERLSTGGGTPAPVRALMRFLKQCRPLLLEQLSDVDPDVLKSFVTEIRDQLNVIVDTPTEPREAAGQHDDDDQGAGDDAGRRPA